LVPGGNRSAEPKRCQSVRDDTHPRIGPIHVQSNVVRPCPAWGPSFTITAAGVALPRCGSRKEGHPMPTADNGPSPDDLARAYEMVLERQQGPSARPGPEGAAGAPAEGAAEPASPPPLPRIIEAMLFVGGAPLSAARASEAVRGLTAAQLAQVVDAL